MINTFMKLKDILFESPTDVVARFYKDATESYDRAFNKENVKYKEDNGQYYKDHFDSWFKEEKVPIFKKPVDKPQPEYTNKPKEGKLQSPGYRGLQYALAAAGLPYDKDVQEYKTDPAKIIATQTMDSVRNANGN